MCLSLITVQFSALLFYLFDDTMVQNRDGRLVACLSYTPTEWRRRLYIANLMVVMAGGGSTLGVSFWLIVSSDSSRQSLDTYVVEKCGTFMW